MTHTQRRMARELAHLIQDAYETGWAHSPIKDGRTRTQRAAHAISAAKQLVARLNAQGVDVRAALAEITTR